MQDDPKFLTHVADVAAALMDTLQGEKRAQAMAGLTKARVLASGKALSGDRAAVFQAMEADFERRHHPV